MERWERGGADEGAQVSWMVSIAGARVLESLLTRRWVVVYSHYHPDGDLRYTCESSELVRSDTPYPGAQWQCMLQTYKSLQSHRCLRHVAHQGRNDIPGWWDWWTISADGRTALHRYNTWMRRLETEMRAYNHDDEPDDDEPDGPIDEAYDCLARLLSG